MTTALSSSSENACREITPFRVLSLDGGGAKGFYTLGILRELEALTGKPLAESFDERGQRLCLGVMVGQDPYRVQVLGKAPRPARVVIVVALKGV
jgi:hypothetical protein